MSTKPESRLQRRIQGALAAAFPGCYIRKIHVSEFSAEGTPDLLCCIQGHFIALEVKTPGEEPTLLQAFNLNSIRQAGGLAAVVSSPQQAVALVQKFINRRA